MTSAPLPPTLHQLDIAAGGSRAVVTRAGATLRAYEVDGRPAVEAFPAEEAPVGGHGQVLMPWPNRVRDGAWTWRGAPQQLALTQPGEGHAAHGLVRFLAWDVIAHAADRVELAVDVPAQLGWPVPLRATAAYDVSGAGLRVVVTATNLGAAPCPWGAGQHPYLAVPGGRVDDAVLRVPAGAWLELDDRNLPVRRHPTAASPHDFRAGRRVGDAVLDTPFTDLERGPDGRVEAHLTAPDGRTTTVWGEESVRWWQVFTGDTLPPAWRRTAVAVEPMTCPPDALNSGEDLAVLQPGETRSLTWGVRVG